MKSCGVILTYMVWKDWKQWWFNIPLFVFQLIFMIVGTAYGKIKWPKLERWQDRIIGVILTWVFVPFIWFLPKWWSIPMVIIGAFIGIATLYRDIDWRRVWRAAQCSHVRLCLVEHHYVGDEFINFGYPEAEIQSWRMDQCKDQFEYRDPTFPTPPEFMEPVIQYAEAQVGKRYDDLQLISSGLHLIAWIVMPWRWGKELKIIKALNRPGGLEHCISGVTACLRWAEFARWIQRPVRNIRVISDYFTGYSTATTFPCMVPISKNWEVT